MRKPTEKTTINNRDQAASKDGYNRRAVPNRQEGKALLCLEEETERQEHKARVQKITQLPFWTENRRSGDCERKRSFSKSVSFWILFNLSLDINHPQWALKQCSNMALGSISYSLRCSFIHSVAAI